MPYSRWPGGQSYDVIFGCWFGKSSLPSRVDFLAETSVSLRYNYFSMYIFRKEYVGAYLDIENPLACHNFKDIFPIWVYPARLATVFTSSKVFLMVLASLYRVRSINLYKNMTTHPLETLAS